MAGAVAAFGAYAALLAPLGFVVATTATVSTLSMLFGAPWKKAVAAALTLSVVLWYLFVWVLGLILPLGSLWEAVWMR
jgi:putative tricarboxylic transport membrane protein